MRCCPSSAPFFASHHDDVRGLIVVSMRCLRCWSHLPLGPANDGGPFAQAVAIERRAAELARYKFEMEHRSSSRFRPDYCERAGWRGEETIDSLHVRDDEGELRIDRNVPLNLDGSSWQSGYLARCIVEHDGEGSE